MAERNKPIALVTGGTRGIGLGIAKHLAQSGFDVAVNGRREKSEVTESLQAIEAAGANAHYFQADLGTSEARQDLMQQLRGSLGRLDVLVNNAGVSPTERKDLLEATSTARGHTF
jgi:NAD(P)-dependent dehydrogenase (short-subunit alcohol dehydrogenase family)